MEKIRNHTRNEWKTPGFYLVQVYSRASDQSYSYCFDLLIRCLMNKELDHTLRGDCCDAIGNLQSYWTTTKLRELTVVLNYYEVKETYSHIGLLRS